MPADLAAITRSMDDSVRFAVTRTIVTGEGHAHCISSFVDPDGTPMTWHDFGTLEGPGWASNAVGGALEILLHARLRGSAAQERLAVSLVDHVLEDGFTDRETGVVTGYRDSATGAFCANFKHTNDWFCPGSMARVGCQMLAVSDFVDARRAGILRDVAARMARWLTHRVRPGASGWYPRRCAPGGETYTLRAEGGPDPLAEGSADGIFILQLFVELAARGLADHAVELRRRVDAFVRAGGVFGSINHDTYDTAECVSFAAAFRVLLRAARLLGDEALRRFAYQRCLSGLDAFTMAEDRNGVATRGLLFMEKSWDTAYLWENAEAALAFLDAADDGAGEEFRERAAGILEAISLHHHGPHGFLTEGVDWNNHVSALHHFDGAEFGDIRYTEPLLNNLHITEPTIRLLASR